MKKNFLKCAILLGLVVVSCDNNELLQEQNLNDNTQDVLKRSFNPQENSEFEVHGIYFPNGVSTGEGNNMLHFSSYEEYESLLAGLEAGVELHEDQFVSMYDHLDEDELNEIEESTGFNEDLPLEDFESLHSFYSLRKATVTAENNWLQTSDQPSFSWDDNPDNFTYIDGVEQTFYNTWHEVMIYNTIYKITETGYYTIDATRPDASVALSAINANIMVNPEDIVSSYPGTVSYNSGISNTCIYTKNRTKTFTNGKYRIEAKQKMKTGTFNIVYKSVTKNYKKVGSKWKKRRIHSYAGLQGQFKNCNFSDCTLNPYFHVDSQRSTYKKRRRREHAIRLPRRLCPYQTPGTLPNKLWSVHKQNSWVVEWVFEHNV